MKRTEKKLKSKGIKTHKPTNAHACSWFKYNRNFVANHLGDATFVPFSRGSMRYDRLSSWDHPNRFLRHYLEKFFHKQIGKIVYEVFYDFCGLGWKHSYDMYSYWEEYVNPNHPRGCYSIDANGCLVSPTKENRLSPPSGFDDDTDEDDEKPEPKRPKASEKRLTRKLLEYNESIITTKIADDGYGNAVSGLLGEMYVENEHKVEKRNVYLVKVPHNPSKQTPVTLLGLYREERHFYHDSVTSRIETTFNEKEKIYEAEIIRDKRDSGELIPCI